MTSAYLAAQLLVAGLVAAVLALLSYYVGQALRQHRRLMQEFRALDTDLQALTRAVDHLGGRLDVVAEQLVRQSAPGLGGRRRSGDA